jgi:hypothetical protein
MERVVPAYNDANRLLVLCTGTSEGSTRSQRTGSENAANHEVSVKAEKATIASAATTTEVYPATWVTCQNWPWQPTYLRVKQQRILRANPCWAGVGFCLFSSCSDC